MFTQTSEVTRAVRQVMDALRTVIVGKDTQLLWMLAAILARGHILLEDVPGVGKTTTALAFARVLDLPWRRMQFTPDVLPSDVTGFSIPQLQTGQLQFQPGPILTNLFLADELNRAPCRTQSALLEAMEEEQITVDGQTHRLPRPFVVIATQNPFGSAGTQLLPDSQLDRFTVRLSLGYPSEAEEIAMLTQRQSGNPLETLSPVLTRAQLCRLQDTVAATFLSERIAGYIVSLAAATRNHAEILRGASPRSALSICAMARAAAQLRGRDYVVPGDVKEIFLPTIAHRLILTPRTQTQGEQILQEILETVPTPLPV